MDYFEMNMTARQVNEQSMLALAHVGDAVFELMVRTMLCSQSHASVAQLHRQSVALVRAQAQSAASEKLLSLLTEEELVIFKRGRNAKVHSVPHNAELADYHAATALEALFGWLFLQGRKDRLNELFSAMMEA